MSFSFASFERKDAWFLLALTFLVFVGLWRWMISQGPDPALPIVQADRRGSIAKLIPTRFYWIIDGPAIIAKGLADFNETPFQVPSTSGWKVILPTKYAEELRNNENLSFTESVKKDFLAGYPGFDAFTEGLKDDFFMQEVVRVRLTQSLAMLTDDLVDETNDSLHNILGEDAHYESVAIKERVLDIVSRLSSRILLGLPLCRNQAWLDIAKGHTVDLFKSAQLMRLVPAIARPLLYLVPTPCKRIKAQVQAARRLINEEVRLRRERTQKILDAGEKPPKQADAIAWMTESSHVHGRVPDFVAAQLALSMAAIHTTSETISNAILALCESPELIRELRAEVIEVLTTNGWSKQTLYKLRIMDSFLKESQRVRPMSATSMNRLVLKDITLSDGIVLRAGSRIMIRDSKDVNAEAFPEPEKFDPHRFLKMRDHPGEENRHQFVTLTADHMSFGYGTHACPGRFFAANEIKILFCFLLLKYEFRYLKAADGIEDQKPTHFSFENAIVADPRCKIQIRRREEEIDLMDPSTGKASIDK
ncbi:Dihydromonacolin L monooxygenase LovA [Cyphellophora attinorum]|uniref:Dihydromonacolin L monooxygenase LovA n=1 Tax=Cyphellophora attinorum TaxID=1664694 RepID=A0A0N0NNW2_9EURO|nr:Dihydromonacolin L monooxygenase LovA [Phialophora attinorum]KPI42051.1 Dihydromonacolin L monooxygenase LovA [Phialophora attinorum]